MILVFFVRFLFFQFFLLLVEEKGYTLTFIDRDDLLRIFVIPRFSRPTYGEW